MATPSVLPSSRAVSLTADPTPALAGGNEPMIASVAGAWTSPSPPPRNSMAPTRTQYDVATPVTAEMAKPTAIDTSPAVTTALVPMRSASLADSGAVEAVNTANGTVRTPASSVP